MPALQNRLKDEILWPFHSGDFSLERDEVHVWAASLDVAGPGLAQCESLLAPEECQRADRFHFERDRNRFIAGRGFLRSILARYLQTDPAKIEFAYGPQGKPSLAGSVRFEVAPGSFRVSQRLHFNLAHSESLALASITQLGPIGVDVERIRALDDADELVARFFSSRETAAFRELPPDQRSVAFFNLWTRKEAWLKATGEGIAHSLNRVEVSFLPGEPAQYLALPKASDRLAHWSLHDLSPAPGFAAALATSGTHTCLNCWRWPEPASLEL